MKMTREERVKKGLLRFGRKNRICGILAVPALVVSMFFFHGIAYLKGNGKRFSMAALTFCLFAVYSSFSFPLFISGQGRTATLSLSDAASDVELAPEVELTPEDFELLDDEDVLEGEELAADQDFHDMDGVEIYEASEILASLEGRESARGQADETSASEGSLKGGKVSAGAKPEFDREDWRLVLINKQHSIPEDYSFNLATITGRMQCDERILDDLSDMLQAAKDDGMNLQIRSPYRTHDRQEMLFESKIDIYMKRGMSYMEAYQLASQAVTVPGNSEHEIGLALDIVCDTYGLLEEGFADTEEGKWLAANSYRYGFILRYPKGKEYVTGIEFEPWHFRYVGVEAATYITEQGITLEELWEEL